MPMLFDIIHEDEDFLAINKPSGLVCHPTTGDEYSSLVSRVRLYFGPNSVAHLVNRLDRETSGVVLFAKNETASREVKKLFEKRLVQKTYLAIVHGFFSSESLVYSGALGPDEESPVWSKDKVRPDGASAETHFQTLHQFEREGASYSLVEAKPKTGRKHQIRIHLSALGHSIVGDKIYGDTEQYYLAMIGDRITPEMWDRLKLPHHALHGEKLSFEWKGKPWVFRAPCSEMFFNFLDEVGKEKVRVRSIQDKVEHH